MCPVFKSLSEQQKFNNQTRLGLSNIQYVRFSTVHYLSFSNPTTIINSFNNVSWPKKYTLRTKIKEKLDLEQNLESILNVKKKKKLLVNFTHDVIWQANNNSMWAHLVGYLSLEKRNGEKQVVTKKKKKKSCDTRWIEWKKTFDLFFPYHHPGPGRISAHLPWSRCKPRFIHPEGGGCPYIFFSLNHDHLQSIFPIMQASNHSWHTTHEARCG